MMFRMDPLLLPWSKPLQHVSTLVRQFLFDLIFIMENVVLLGIALNSNIIELKVNYKLFIETRMITSKKAKLISITRRLNWLFRLNVNWLLVAKELYKRLCLSVGNVRWFHLKKCRKFAFLHSPITSRPFLYHLSFLSLHFFISLLIHKSLTISFKLFFYQRRKPRLSKLNTALTTNDLFYSGESCNLLDSFDGFSTRGSDT